MRVSHDVKCWAVGHRRMWVPISDTNLSAVYGGDAIDLRQVDPTGEIVERSPDVEGGVSRARFPPQC
jgi:hypothetical protein